MSGELVRFSLDDHVATITINRPEVRNALNRAAYRELEEAFAEAQRDPEVRAVVLTGADPSFCSGDDVKQIMLGEERPTLDRLRAVRGTPTPAALAILECDRPVIAAVNGPAVGWGMDLSLFADIRIASERARFGELFVKRGLIPDLGGLWRLPRTVGPAKAAELLLHRRRHRRAGGAAHRPGVARRPARRADAHGAGAGEPHRRQRAARGALHQGRSAPLRHRRAARAGDVDLLDPGSPVPDRGPQGGRSQLRRAS